MVRVLRSNWYLSMDCLPYRKFRNSDVPTAVIKNAPDFCSVYVISSKGKVQSNKLATQSQTNANGTGAHSFIQKSQKALFPDFPEKSAQSFDLSRLVTFASSHFQIWNLFTEQQVRCNTKK